MFADCGKIKPSAPERPLLPRGPVSERKGPDHCIWREPIDDVPSLCVAAALGIGQTADTAKRLRAGQPS